MVLYDAGNHWRFTPSLQYIGSVDTIDGGRQNFCYGEESGHFCPDLTSSGRKCIMFG